MSGLNRFGSFTGGDGDGQVPLWTLAEAQARPLFRGASAQWVFDDLIVCGAPLPGKPGFQPHVAIAPEFVPQPIDLTPFDVEQFECNRVVGGGGHWAAYSAATGKSIGAVPPDYATWTCWSFSRDGIRTFLKNGVFAILWPLPHGAIELGAEACQACEGHVVTVTAQTITIHRPGLATFTPAQRPGMKWDARTIDGTDGQWIGYLSDQLGKYIVHHVEDASRGYVINVGDTWKPEGTVLAADPPNRCVVEWGAGAHMQAADLRRTVIVLGEGMLPFVVPPVIEPPIVLPPEPPIVWPPIEPPDPPDHPVIEPPSPEEPMPPTDPLKPGKTRDAYLDALARTISIPAHENFLMPFESARQGILQTWDQLNAAQDWMSGNACVRGACSRSGQSSVIVDPLLWDRVSPQVRAIDREFLQRG